MESRAQTAIYMCYTCNQLLMLLLFLSTSSALFKLSSKSVETADLNHLSKTVLSIQVSMCQFNKDRSRMIDK